jgi:hypothetical protein
MARQNRVTPLGDLVADPARGLVYGNRGCLHDGEGRVRRRYAVQRWIACRLEFKGRRRALMQPGRYTELFFLDEATAFAAGHRPCAECRRADYDRFVSLWAAHHRGERGADAIDRRLHEERLAPATRLQRRHGAAYGDLPGGAFVLRGDAPWLVCGDALLRWSAGGYTEAVARPADAERAVVLTPPALVAVLREGWAGAVPLVHPSAGELTA